MILITIIGALLAGYLLVYGVFWLSHILVGLAPADKKENYVHSLKHEVLIILPAYKPGSIFFRVLDRVAALAENKPIHVYVLLQEAEDVFCTYAKAKGFYVEQKSFQSYGGNSYQHALRHISAVISREWNRKWNPEFVMILDKDNLIDLDFFDTIPPRYYSQFDIIQGKRHSLNESTPVAFFDSLSESLNDVMFRQAKAKLGLPVEISGSGALIETELFIDAIEQLDPRAPGFDKNFMVQLLCQQRDVRMCFHPESKVYEEKTAAWEAHSPQRVRWFGEQYYNALHHGLRLIRTSYTKRRISALDYLLTLWRPPRSVQIVMTFLLSLIEVGYWQMTGEWPLHIPLFTIGFSITFLAVFIFLVRQRKVGRALRYSLSLPRLAFLNLTSSLRSVRKENQGKFIHTSHELQ